ncbi:MULTISPECIES: BTAD domain-containing putative transcriptional regulator [Amycolatopsis]|uniref:DNA-binding transcriptional activator of the SARP family n=2 Tax=Amycolatopsis TaxID=1813 RepID=A0A1I3WMF5_9PSEU|nr:BTAD domain-containing putative transcriptional regulator [Amycolatopsis sacchari]SFK08665.1 DNA-binding transcriptional activator of the SARP family [Amycolatopsis sacchari]
MSGIPRTADFRVLGALEVVAGEHVLALGGPQLRVLLALLLAAGGRAVGVGTLVDELWGPHAPHDADRTVRTYVSRLRKSLQPAAGAAVIVTRAPGYALLLDPDLLDAGRFERLAAAGRAALGAGRPGEAAEQLAAALALWRGAAYDGFDETPSLRTEAHRLTELRDNALEDRIDADLERGLGRELVGELEALTAAHPDHERFWAQLMKALYRAGRQADALRTFRRARQLLLEEAGVEPSPLLTGIQRQILAHDTALLASADESGPLPAGTRALLDDGDLRTSRRHFEIAYERAERAGDANVLARAALGLSGLWVHEHRTATGVHQMRERLHHALSVVADDDSLALRLRVRQAGEADYRSGGHAEILALLEETRVAGDPVAHAEALSIAHHCLLGPEHGRLRQSLAWELIGESLRTGRRADRLMGLLWHTVDLFLAADPHAERRLVELEEALAERDNLAVGFAAAAMRVMLTIRSGRFEEAEKQAQACAELGDAAGDADAMGWYGAHLVAIRWFQGRLGELLPMLDELVHSSSLSTIDNSYFAARAVAAAVAGDRRKAASSLARLTGRDVAGVPRSSTWLVAMNGVAETAFRLGDAAAAAEVYALLSPYADLPIMASLAVACFGSAHYALGVASLAAGELDRAVWHLRTAVRHNLALGHWPAVTVSRARHAEALTLRDAPGDAAMADTELSAAHRDAWLMGMSLAR